MSPDTHSLYRSNADSAQLEGNRISRRGVLFSLIRVALFILALVLLLKGYKTHLLFAVVSSSSAFILLLVFARMGQGLSARKKMLGELGRINEEEILALERRFNGFYPGKEYMDSGHGYTSDLDIFGEHSLFQYLNRTSISSGRDRLAAWLKEPAPREEILGRQEAIRELADRIDWRQKLLATGRMSEETRDDYIQLQRWLNEETFMISNRFYRAMIWILPSLTFLSLILAIQWIPYNVPVFLLLLQLGLVGLNLRRINHHHNQLSRKYHLIDKFSSMILLVETENFRCEYLERLKAGLGSSGINAGSQLRYLSRLVMQFDRRLNMIMGVVLNGLLMWDLHCMFRLEKWKSSNAKEVERWFGILGEFEALSSLANYAFNHPDSVYPEFPSEGVIIEADAIGHPLIPEDENVRNDLKISKPGDFILVTGSNMAGKSTFLRSVGVNMVLAGAGAPVIAARLKWTPVRILTSMRVSDSLNERESTFYAELKRLKMILDVLKTGGKVMVILDEILKGTNSRDKHFGSEMFIRQLIREESTGLIATHDLELSRLEEEFPEQLFNYCFEVKIEQEEFVYDYKLRRGVCQTLNATELMKKMGISIDGEREADRKKSERKETQNE
jgi:DNA mismatch repair ATPase MutS